MDKCLAKKQFRNHWDSVLETIFFIYTKKLQQIVTRSSLSNFESVHFLSSLNRLNFLLVYIKISLTNISSFVRLLFCLKIPCSFKQLNLCMHVSIVKKHSRCQSKLLIPNLETTWTRWLTLVPRNLERMGENTENLGGANFSQICRIFSKEIKLYSRRPCWTFESRKFVPVRSSKLEWHKRQHLSQLFVWNV